MLVSSLFGVALLAASALAAPSVDTRSIQKRAAPKIANGFSDTQVKQIKAAFTNALEPASYVATTPASTVDPILLKYFDDGDLDLVKKVFKAILADDSANGAAFLGGVTISPDTPNYKGVLSCKKGVEMATRQYSSSNPTVIVCDPAFKKGYIQNKYTGIIDGVPSVTCSTLQSRVNNKMVVMGTILLHEDTHMTKLVAPPLSKETDDVVYGASGCRSLDKTKATNNADSYAWAATELFWTMICGKTYDDPIVTEDADSDCGNEICTATKENA